MKDRGNVNNFILNVNIFILNFHVKFDSRNHVLKFVVVNTNARNIPLKVKNSILIISPDER